MKNIDVLKRPLSLLISLQSSLRKKVFSNKFTNSTIQQPFIFFHIPKCGRSTLCKVFSEASNNIGKQIFLPYYNSISYSITEKDLFGRDPRIEQKAACAEVFIEYFTTQLISVIVDSNESGYYTQCQRKWGALVSAVVSY